MVRLRVMRPNVDGLTYNAEASNRDVRCQHESLFVRMLQITVHEFMIYRSVNIERDVNDQI